jgi:hypothetical protein
MNLKKTEIYLRVNLLGPGPSSFKKIIYRVAVSQRLGNTALEAVVDLGTHLVRFCCLYFWSHLAAWVLPCLVEDLIVAVLEGLLVLTTRPLIKLCSAPTPRTTCSSEGRDRLAFRTAVLLLAVLPHLRSGTRLSSPELSSLHFPQSPQFAVCRPRSYSTAAIPEGQGIQ